jgi:hypothetical protein
MKLIDVKSKNRRKLPSSKIACGSSNVITTRSAAVIMGLDLMALADMDDTSGLTLAWG